MLPLNLAKVSKTFLKNEINLLFIATQASINFVSQNWKWKRTIIAGPFLKQGYFNISTSQWFHSGLNILSMASIIVRKTASAKKIGTWAYQSISENMSHLMVFYGLE